MSSLVVLLAFAGILSVQSYWVPEMENIGRGFIEGDIVPRGSGYASITGKRWPNNQVHYYIEHGHERVLDGPVRAAIQRYERHTCLRFIKVQRGCRGCIRFYSGRGCSSPVGYNQYGVNDVSLGSGCTRVGTVMHEIGHSIGLYHEQSRPDRDSYVQILWHNIARDSNGVSMDYNFKKERDINSLRTPYDYESMMHYGATAFGINGMQTIKTLKSDKQHLIGNREGFSAVDIAQINLMYRCKTTGGTETGGTGTGGKCKDFNINCNYWAERGECQINPSWMGPNCPLSCNKCQGPVCKDDHEHCDYWMKKGECNANPQYMLAKCMKSCRQC